MEDFWEFVEYIEDDFGYLPVPRNIIRDMQNPLEKYNDNELHQRYRFSRNIIENAPPINQRGLPIPPIVKLCTALRFYASGSFQRVIGDTGSMSQSATHRVIIEVSNRLAANLARYIKFPEGNNFNNRNLF
ncbi:hypothetical protein QE152_g30031 [Popillia japonica]|uniref:Nuclease HARBI1 n=1 Tax=Popillia japonica TaxID=7064 RepID=A0AAW1JF30_POPJA